MSAAVTEIKMSATHSCRVNEEKGHKQPPVQMKGGTAMCMFECVRAKIYCKSAF